MTIPPQRPVYQLFVGIDIAATTFTAAWMPLDGRPTSAVPSLCPNQRRASPPCTRTSKARGWR